MEGKVVLITGACSGIGAETARHFATRGCLLSLTGLSQEGLNQTLRACVQEGLKEDQVLLMTADVQQTDGLKDIVDKTVGKFGRLDVLVNNAGLCRGGSIDDTTVEDYDLMMDVNLKAVLFLTQKAMPHLIESKGNVVSIASLAGLRPIADRLGYSMTKAAVIHFTSIVALDVASKGVRVNVVSPGMVKSPIYATHGVSMEEFERMAKATQAMRRGGTVDEIAKAVLFLADNSQSSFITGANLVADGGGYLMGPL